MQNQLLMKGISVKDFDDSNYYELINGLNAEAPEDRTVSLEEYMSSLGIG